MAIPGAKQTPNEAELRLLDSALHLFSEKGYEGTSIREIIEGAGVTRPVLYYYFQNKEDLFKRLVEARFSEFTGEIDTIIRSVSGTSARLKHVIRKAFSIAEEYPEIVRLILMVFFSPPTHGANLDRNRLAHQRFRLLEEIMRDGLENNELSGGDAQSLALFFVGVMDMHIMAKSNRPETRLTPEYADSLVDLFLMGAAFKEAPSTHLVSPYSFTN
jgi:AcrR family transcriptional regulator